MKKSNFVATILGTVSGLLFSLGMCMTMLTQWNAFIPGIILGAVGLILALVTVFIWRKMEHKKPIHITGKNIFTILIAVLGILSFGVGMCLVLVWHNIVLGVIIGFAGIMFLLSSIPMSKSLR